MYQYNLACKSTQPSPFCSRPCLRMAAQLMFVPTDKRTNA